MQKWQNWQNFRLGYKIRDETRGQNEEFFKVKNPAKKSSTIVCQDWIPHLPGYLEHLVQPAPDSKPWESRVPEKQRSLLSENPLRDGMHSSPRGTTFKNIWLDSTLEDCKKQWFFSEPWEKESGHVAWLQCRRGTVSWTTVPTRTDTYGLGMPSATDNPSTAMSAIVIVIASSFIAPPGPEKKAAFSGESCIPWWWRWKKNTHRAHTQQHMHTIHS